MVRCSVFASSLGEVYYYIEKNRKHRLTLILFSLFLSVCFFPFFTFSFLFSFLLTSFCLCVTMILVFFIIINIIVSQSSLPSCIRSFKQLFYYTGTARFPNYLFMYLLFTYFFPLFRVLYR